MNKFCSRAVGLQAGGAMCKWKRHRVPYSDCGICEHWDGSARGAGDWIAAITRYVGIKPCSGCKGRQKALNAAISTAFGRQLTHRDG